MNLNKTTLTGITALSLLSGCDGGSMSEKQAVYFCGGVGVGATGFLSGEYAAARDAVAYAEKCQVIYGSDFNNNEYDEYASRGLQTFIKVCKDFRSKECQELIQTCSEVVNGLNDAVADSFRD